jgi:hypothetical protein
MQNNSIIKKLIAIKQQISDLGIEFLETKMPVELRDVGITLKPFIELSDSFDKSIKKLTSDDISNSIPKTNTLKP